MIPGIEFSSEYEGRDIHIVGLYIDYESDYFKRRLVHFVNGRKIRNVEMCTRLTEHGMPVTYEELEAEFNILLQQPDSAVKNAERFGSIANEMASLKEQREKIAARLRKDQTVQLHVHTMEEALDEMSHRMQQWDEEMIRQLVHTVKVISADHIKVFLCNGIEIDQTVNP